MEKAAIPEEDYSLVKAARASFCWNLEITQNAQSEDNPNDHCQLNFMLLQLKKLHFLPIYESERKNGSDSTLPSYKASVCIENRKIFVSEKGDTEWSFVYVTDPIALKIESAVIHISSRCVVFFDKKADIYSLKFGKGAGDDDEPRIGEMRKISSHSANIECIVVGQNFSDGLLFSADRDNRIRCSKLSTAYDFQYYLMGHKKPVKGMVLIDDERRLLSVSRDGELRLWDLETYSCIQTFQLPEIVAGSTSNRDSSADYVANIPFISVSSTGLGKRILCAIHLPTPQEGTPVYELSENRESVTFIRTVPSGTFWWVYEKLFIRIEPFTKLTNPLDPAQCNEYLQGVTYIDFGTKNEQELSETAPCPKRLKIL